MTDNFVRHVTDVIRSRSSVRRFIGEPPEVTLLDDLRTLCRGIHQGPLGSHCRFRLVESELTLASKTLRLGTYGMVRGARYYLIGAVKKGPFSMEDYGYLL